ncbi:PEP-CTERM/exosortase system-associated acyltransferase [Chromatiaceae bacterium AAb-1]|nr:PEP-CTERM/exosortase system-associated acyltransferase [Chromatiaceae bacterium AAb-1]
MKRLKALSEAPVIGGVVKKAMATMASGEATTISRHFSAFLRPEIAKTAELKHEVYKLRHQVYCEELNFEDIKENHEEQDEFDHRATHCFIRHLSSGRLAGTVRLIFTEQEGDLLPIEKYCGHAIEHAELTPDHFPRNSICEISRLAVPAEFRRRTVDNFKGAATGAINAKTYSEQELRCFPFIAICLYLAAASMSLKTERVNVFVMMEPRLARSLSFVGIHFQQIGSAIEFHGKRAPYYIDARSLNKTMSPGYKKLLESVQADLFGFKRQRDSGMGTTPAFSI